MGVSYESLKGMSSFDLINFGDVFAEKKSVDFLFHGHVFEVWN